LNYYFDGYWQSEKYFSENENQIFSNFFYDSEQIKLYSKIIEGFRTVSLHIRRGDYVGMPDHYVNLGVEYYKNALDLIGTYDKILLFSDDVKWCKENLNFDNAAKVQASFNKFPWPDKYDDHRIGNNSVNLDGYKLTQEEKDALGIKESELGKGLSSMISSATAGIIENNSQVKYELDKFIKETKVAKELVKKWYSIKEDGSIDFSVFNERIKLSMSEEDKQRVQQAAIAQTEIDKMSNKLINNTFVVFTKLNFVSNAIPAEAIRQIAYTQADKLSGMLQTIARKAADKIYEKTSEGYSVWTTAWLYKLEWNEQIATDFNKLLSSKGINSALSIDINAFNAMNFNLEFIGQEKATSLVTFSLKKGEGDRTEDEIIDLSTVRNVDKVFTKLQREYEEIGRAHV
jgi:hypothetical protein